MLHLRQVHGIGIIEGGRHGAVMAEVSNAINPHCCLKSRWRRLPVSSIESEEKDWPAASHMLRKVSP